MTNSFKIHVSPVVNCASFQSACEWLFSKKCGRIYRKNSNSFFSLKNLSELQSLDGGDVKALDWVYEEVNREDYGSPCIEISYGDKDGFNMGDISVFLDGCNQFELVQHTPSYYAREREYVKLYGEAEADEDYFSKEYNRKRLLRLENRNKMEKEKRTIKIPIAVFKKIVTYFYPVLN